MARVQAGEIAIMLGVSRRTVQVMAAQGALPGAIKIRKLWTFDADRVRDYLANLEAEQSRTRTSPTQAAPNNAVSFSKAKNSEKAYEQAMAKLLGTAATSKTRRSKRKRSVTKA